MDSSGSPTWRANESTPPRKPRLTRTLRQTLSLLPGALGRRVYPADRVDGACGHRLHVRGPGPREHGRDVSQRGDCRNHAPGRRALGDRARSEDGGRQGLRHPGGPTSLCSIGRPRQEGRSLDQWRDDRHAGHVPNPRFTRDSLRHRPEPSLLHHLDDSLPLGGHPHRLYHVAIQF